MRPEECGLPRPTQLPQIRFSDLPTGALSLVVFGPGEGEASVLVFPDGSVGIVDGCNEPRDMGGRGDPVREFLASIPSPRLRFACLTHPHDDHYAGLAALIQHYGVSVEEVWTIPIVVGKFREALLRRNDLLFDPSSPDASAKRGGLENFLSTYMQRMAEGGKVRRLTESAELISETLGGANLIVSSCGPADNDLVVEETHLHEYFACVLSENEPPAQLNPNQTSGAVLVRWGDAAVLLTGDLLSGGRDANSGWNASCARVSRHRIQIINAAHHASEGAHHEGIWKACCPSLAIVTPFRRATGQAPPRPEQIAMLAKSSCVAITSPPAWVEANNPAWPARLEAPLLMSRRSTKTSVRSTALLHRAVPADQDIYNAVAVTLSADGNVIRFLLGGQANLYDVHRAH